MAGVALGRGDDVVARFRGDIRIRAMAGVAGAGFNPRMREVDYIPRTRRRMTYLARLVSRYMGCRLARRGYAAASAVTDRTLGGRPLEDALHMAVFALES